MDRKFWIASGILFVAWLLGDFAIHGVLLAGDYAPLAGKLYRTPEDSGRYFPLMLLAHVLMAVALTWIYAQGRDTAKPWLGQGVRFGIVIALLTSVPTYAIYFVVQPTPGALAVKQMVLSGALDVLLGIIVAWSYRAQAAPAAAAA